ncbi:MAG: IS630 family transposase [Nitrososphaera sp.]|nr:IS630 family transposase [Nitrososphaera sp.]
MRSSQADKESTKEQRIEYWEKIKNIAPENLVFLDEMGVLLGIMRGRARSMKGERVYDIKPFYRGSRVTVVGAISQKKVIRMKTMGKSINGEEFLKFVQEELAPKLWKGAVVVMDNLRVHKVEGVEEMIEAVGARVVYLSPYSPEFNPIEHLWWELKALLRRFIPKSVQIVEKLLELGVKLCSSKQIRNYFAHCCYCTSYSRKVL